MKHFPDAISKAASDTARYMTADIRRSARQHGWADHEISAISVSYDGKAFNASLEGEHASAAWDREYGTETQRPTAVLRKYSNNPGKAEAVFMKQLSKHLGRL